MLDEFPDYRFVVAGLSNIGEEFYRKIIGNRRCEIVFDQTYNLLKKSAAAIVTSGTSFSLGSEGYQATFTSGFCIVVHARWEGYHGMADNKGWELRAQVRR